MKPQYIDKADLVAEIKSRIDRDNERAASFSSNSEHDYLYRVKEEVYKSLLHFLDTLEVKEMDLEKFDKEVTKIWGRCAAEPNDSIACLHIETFIEIARHFYNLGLNDREEK